jgi:hypothetical protein
MSDPQHVDKAARAEWLLAQIRAGDEEIQAAMKSRNTSRAFLDMLCNEQWQLIVEYNELRWPEGGA